ncbi:integrator complex subunit 2-domain-containing protein [Coemansia spiralis]|nr:integrator complex subunit 2-domain-containing protein [Coemansia spiralis]
MPGTPHHISDMGTTTTAAAATPEMQNIAQKLPLTDDADAAEPGHKSASAQHEENAAGVVADVTPYETKQDYYDEGEEDEVVGGGCVGTASSASGSGNNGANTNGNESGNGTGFARAKNAITISDTTTIDGQNLALFNKDKVGGKDSRAIIEDTQASMLSSALIPSSLKDSAAYSTLFTDETTASSTFDAIYPTDTSTSGLDDSWPLNHPEDYEAVAREAHSHWRSRIKQPAEALEQSTADIRDFMLGSARRRLRIVLIQLNALLTKTPSIYEILESKQNLESSNPAQAWLERKLNSLWTELKARCSLLIMDKEAESWDMLNQTPLPDSDDFADKASSVQMLVLLTLKDTIENCSLLWSIFENSIRGLILVNSSEEILKYMYFAAQRNTVGTRKTILRTLLESYLVLPDRYKAVIRDVVEAIATNAADESRLVILELQRYKILPGVLFRTLAKCVQTDSGVSQVTQLLDDLFTSNAYVWIGQTTSKLQPKYAQAGAEIRRHIQCQFFNFATDELKQKYLLRFMRTVAGLVGHLRLDVQVSDLDLFRRTASLVTDNCTADVSVSLLLVLIGFGTQITTQDILDTIAQIDNSLLVASRIDCLLAYLLTDHVKHVEDFVKTALGMCFPFPRERLFFLKELVLQSCSTYLTDANIARRLISKDKSIIQRVAAHRSSLQQTAVLYFLQSTVFQDNGIDVREWVTDSIHDVDAAIADEFGAVMKAYVAAIFSSSAITPIPEALLWRIFSPETIFATPGNNVPPAQVLYLLYILSYSEHLLEQPKKISGRTSALSKRALLGHTSNANGQSFANQHGISPGIIGSRSSNLNPPAPNRLDIGRSSPMSSLFGAVRRGEYSDQFIDSLPIPWILHRVSRSVYYRQIWPELLSMAIAQHPDQLDVVAMLQHELAVNTVFSRSSKLPDSKASTSPLALSDTRSGMFAGLTKDVLGVIRHIALDLADNRDTQALLPGLLSAIEQYTTYPAAVRMETCNLFSEHMCRIALLHYKNEELVTFIRQAWFSLHELNPHTVSTATANAWKSESEATKPKLIPQDIWLDPLVLFRSDARVFRSPGLTDILLTILAEFLVLSRSTMRRIHMLRQVENGEIKKQHISALIQLQESSALQLLIEITRLSKNEAVRALIFEFIHARFLEQRTVQKLVHFQAYELSAIDDMVKHVPSMHACSEFIPEMLMQSVPRLQLFSIKLAASITSNYPIIANEGMTREVVLPHIKTTLIQIAGTMVAEQLAICNAMLEAIISINDAFPLIRQDCVALINAVREAAADKAHAIMQGTQQQHSNTQNLAKWIGSCESVLQTIESNSLQFNRPHFIPIEDINADDFMPKLESLSQPPDKKNNQFGNSSLLNVPEAGTQQTGFSASLPSHGSQASGLQSHISGQILAAPQPNSQSSSHNAVSGTQKRPHSIAMSNSDRSLRITSTSPSAGTMRGLSPPPQPNPSGQSGATMSLHPSSAPPIHMLNNPGSSGSVPSPPGFKKRGRHRGRVLGSKEIGSGKISSSGSAGIKRSKVPGGDRQRPKDY